MKNNFGNKIMAFFFFVFVFLPCSRIVTRAVRNLVPYKLSPRETRQYS